MKIKKSKKKSVPPLSNESKPDPRRAPRQIWEDHPSRKHAYERAKNCHGAAGEPQYHARDTHDSPPHYHPTHKDRTKCHGIHIGYPKSDLWFHKLQNDTEDVFSATRSTIIIYPNDNTQSEHDSGCSNRPDESIFHRTCLIFSNIDCSPGIPPETNGLV
jgi:hypothetical protein